jgi:hypothetical protein
MEEKNTRNLFLGLNKHHVTKVSEEFRVSNCTCFTSAVDRVEWEVSGSCYFTFLNGSPGLI